MKCPVCKKEGTAIVRQPEVRLKCPHCGKEDEQTVPYTENNLNIRTRTRMCVYCFTVYQTEEKITVIKAVGTGNPQEVIEFVKKTENGQNSKNNKKSV